MADKKPPPPNHYFLALQEREMRRLELGEARANEDWDRVSEINAEMKKKGVTGIGYENQVADSAFGEFERREEQRSRRDVEFEPTTPTARRKATLKGSQSKTLHSSKPKLPNGRLRLRQNAHRNAIRTKGLLAVTTR